MRGRFRTAGILIVTGFISVTAAGAVRLDGPPTPRWTTAPPIHLGGAAELGITPPDPEALDVLVSGAGSPDPSEAGSTVVVVSDSDFGNSRVSRTDDFDQRGDVVYTVREFDDGRDGSIDLTLTSRYSYDERHNLVYRLDEREEGLNGIGPVETLRFSYDQHGNLVEQIVEAALPTNGVVYFRATTTLTYDDHEHLVQKARDVDFDADGTVDERFITTFTYDERGNQVSEVDEFDNHADGVIESRLTITSTYDLHGRLARQVAEHVLDTTTSTFTYDQHGRVILQVDDVDDSSDGDIDSRNTTTSTYDERGNELEKVTENDTADGIVHSRRTLTSTYDQRGIILQRILAFDRGADGTIDARSTDTFEYFGTPRRPRF